MHVTRNGFLLISKSNPKNLGSVLEVLNMRIIADLHKTDLETWGHSRMRETKSSNRMVRVISLSCISRVAVEAGHAV